jgi:hypothetical protein
LSSKPNFLIFEFNKAFPKDALTVLSILENRLGFTKAHYVVTDLDLETVPTMSIDDFKAKWVADAPAWGNITVS